MKDLLSGSQKEGLILHAFWTAIPDRDWIFDLACELRKGKDDIVQREPGSF
jgi:hypothetical protein